jgi:hypothetical protein
MAASEYEKSQTDVGLSIIREKSHYVTDDHFQRWQKY